MAYAWRIGNNAIGFNLDECEEVLLMAAYLAARDTNLNESWLRDFETMFLDSDRGAGDRFVGLINATLRHLGLVHLVHIPQPSRRTNYMDSRGAMKTAVRQANLKRLLRRDAAATRAVADARTAASALWTAADTDDEQAAMFEEARPRTDGLAHHVVKLAQKAPAILASGEMARRKAALAALRTTPADAAPTAPRTTPAEAAVASVRPAPAPPAEDPRLAEALAEMAELRAVIAEAQTAVAEAASRIDVAAVRLARIAGTLQPATDPVGCNVPATATTRR